MFRSKKMKKVRLIVLKSHTESLIRDLHEAGLIDIRKTKYDGLDEGRPLQSFDELSASLLKLRTVLSLMESALEGRVSTELGTARHMEGAKALAETKHLAVEAQLRKLNQEANEITERLRILESQALVIEKVLHFKNVDFSRLNSKILTYRIGEIAAGKMARLGEMLENLGGHTALVAEKGFNVILILFDRKNGQPIDTILTDVGFNDIELPEAMSTPMAAINRITTESDSGKAKLKLVRNEMLELSKANVQKVSLLIHSLEIEADRAEIATRFSSSKCAYVLEGWVLQENVGRLEGLIQKYPDVVIEDIRFGHHEAPPIVLDNPKIASPMEFITKSYSLPNYFEIDPTIAYLIALPIIYGMIVGDVIYGLMSMGIAYWLMKKFEKSYIMSNVSKIWLYSAIPAVFFGVFFDEWAGMSHYHLLEFIGKWTGIELIHGPLYTGFHRIESVLALIGLTVLVGMLHLTLGFIFGAINEWHHNKKHSIAKIAWIGIEVGVLLSLLPFMPGMLPELGTIDPSLTPAGLAVLAVSAVTLAITEGVVGVIEIPGLIGNILSYSRIAAIGIVGVVIAELLNEFIMPTPDKGIILALVLAPVFLIFHVLNCFVAMFESLVQGGRLNIVEFRSKFLHGGGDLFIPFALYSKKL